MKRLYVNLVLGCSAISLSIASFLVVLKGAADEPYFDFRESDAIVQVGVAMVIMLLWFQLAGGMIYGFIRRRISLWWLPLLLWVLICEFYLYQCPSGYVQDITKFVGASK